MHPARLRTPPRARLALILLALIGVGRVAAAQTSPIELVRVHPDFTGTWKLVRNDITGAPAAKDPLSMFTFGPSLTMLQTSAAIQIATWQVHLDGTITTGPSGSTISGEWNGLALVLTEREPVPGGGASSEHRVVLRLADDGTLTVEISSKLTPDVVLVRSTYQRATGPGTADAHGVFTPGRGISPPVLLHEEKPVYTRQALTAEVHGTVDLDITVLPDGTVDPATVTVTKSLDKQDGLDDQAVAAARLWRFISGVDQATGKAVPCRVSIVMTFKLGG